MSKANCKTVRRELDELTPGNEYRSEVLAHLKECSECREFDEKQMKLRQIVGSLGTVAAPSDFDFRLRSRLASDNARSSFHFGALGLFGTRSAAVVVGLALLIGTVVGVRYLTNRSKGNQNIAETVGKEPAKATESPKPLAAKTATPPVKQEGTETRETTVTATNVSNRRTQSAGTRVKRAMATNESASTQATVIRAPETSADTVIPVDASQQSLRVSLFDGRGNPRTISVPTVTFGSQRVVPQATSFAPKGVW